MVVAGGDASLLKGEARGCLVLRIPGLLLLTLNLRVLVGEIVVL